MKKEYNAMYDKLAPQKSDDELLQAVLSENAEGSAAKRNFRSKPLFVAAVTIIASLLLLLTVNAATQGAVVKFFMGGDELEGEYSDYVDGDGFRHVSFSAIMPIDEKNFAVIFDVDAPYEEAVRVITDETDPEFMDKIRRYNDECFEYSTLPDPEKFGLVFKDSEHCTYSLSFDTKDGGSCISGGGFGGKFMNIGAATKHPTEVRITETYNDCTYDPENKTKTYWHTFYYYVGKE